ncbi:hypothetical protein TorRG33x02_178930 [Trema orientale]|uniref:Uncharacterized protein n=1 Tax=Trema orientale TaxID=63057 RepID=A0A2P5EL92_TREOI|nr:hypothetical protein TorRG33x02_178930 [Trema orientale]
MCKIKIKIKARNNNKHRITRYKKCHFPQQIEMSCWGKNQLLMGKLQLVGLRTLCRWAARWHKSGGDASLNFRRNNSSAASGVKEVRPNSCIGLNELWAGPN